MSPVSFSYITVCVCVCVFVYIVFTPIVGSQTCVCVCVCVYVCVSHVCVFHSLTGLHLSSVAVMSSTLTSDGVFPLLAGHASQSTAVESAQIRYVPVLYSLFSKRPHTCLRAQAAQYGRHSDDSLQSELVSPPSSLQRWSPR